MTTVSTTSAARLLIPLLVVGVVLSGALGGCAEGGLVNRATMDAALGVARQECDRMEGVIIHEGDDAVTVNRRLETVRAGCDFTYHLLEEALDHADLAN